MGNGTWPNLAWTTAPILDSTRLPHLVITQFPPELRVGKAKAVTATARKIAVLFYNALRHGMDYTDPGASYYEERYRQRVLTNLQRRAKSLGYVLQQVDAVPAANGVS